MNLRLLRFCIVCLWLVYLGQVLTYQLYDPILSSPILHIAKILLDNALKNNWLFFTILVLEASLLIYASAALWFGHVSGKWAFLTYVVLGLIDNYFVSVYAFSWIAIILVNLYFLFLGIILMGVNSDPLKTHLAETKPFHFWKIFGMFFLFFIVYFTLPLSFNYLL